jgi:hypothetical protein
LGTLVAYGRPDQMDLILGCYVCMLMQGWDLPRELQHEIMLIIETGFYSFPYLKVTHGIAKKFG